MSTLIIFHNILSFLELRSLLMTCAYILIALALDSNKGIVDFVERIWSINQNGEADTEKFLLIKSFIEVNVDKWDKYWQLHQEIVKGCKKKSPIRRYILKIPRGTISLKQFIWILGYMSYNVLHSQNIIPHISDVFHFLIDLYGLGFFIFTGSSIIGLKDFMINIFESIKPVKEKSVKQGLSLLESNIIFGAKHYGFLRNRCDINEKTKELVIK